MFNACLCLQYPVVSVDSDLPIMNPFSGVQFGQLRVLLGMGSTEQVKVLLVRTPVHYKNGQRYQVPSVPVIWLPTTITYLLSAKLSKQSQLNPLL